MKLMIQADDYGITPAVVDGIVACGKAGVMTMTGIFMNMPWVDYAIERYKEIPNVLLGIDLNISTGGPVADSKLIPTLVQENGQFLTSSMHRAKEKATPGSVNYDEVMIEYEAQINRFIKAFGHTPGYITGHAWHNEDTDRAMREIAKKYNVFCAHGNTVYEDARLESIWARPIVREDGTFDFSPAVQKENDPLKLFLEGKLPGLTEKANTDEVVMLHLHAGYVDGKLMKLSTFNVVRAMEASFLMSDEFKSFLEENKVELINCLDLL